jgi:N-acetylglucosamine-6-phosphate deacetylase
MKRSICVHVTDCVVARRIQVNISEERKATLIGHPETLAGSVATMQESVQNFSKIVGVVDALTAATLHPAQALGLEETKGSLLPGRDADFVLLNDDLEVQATYIAGQACWAREAHAAALFYSPRKNRIDRSTVSRPSSPHKK